MRDSSAMALNVGEVWIEWKRLTRFLECSRIAFQRELNIWDGLEIPDLGAVKILTTDGNSEFKVTASEHIETLRDDALLCFIVLIYSYSLCECFARIRLGLGECEPIPGGVEIWGEKLLTTTGNTWKDVLGGRAGLIEVAVVRNFISHGSRTVSQSTLDRFANSKESSPWALGDSVSLSYGKVEEYRSRLKSLMRLGSS